MKAGWRVAWLFGMGIAVGLLVTGGVLWVLSPPRGSAILLPPPPSPSPVVVHVSGAVENPGVYTLPAGSRVQDAIQAAGGGTSEGEIQALNLAAPLQDGDRLYVPSKIAPQQGSDLNKTTDNGSDEPVSTQAGSLININSASREQLESLPGIGPTLAQRIIEYRLAYGPFPTIESVQEVNGIGPVKYEQIKALITVETIP